VEEDITIIPKCINIVPKLGIRNTRAFGRADLGGADEAVFFYFRGSRVIEEREEYLKSGNALSL